MNKTQAKEYNSSLWRARCLQIIRADGGKCCQCGRKDPDVILQVHHKKYIPGRKPWEYPQEDLITLCKGCHAREHNLLKDAIPQYGWKYEGMDDLEDIEETCQLCGTEIRYVHYLSHSDFGCIVVGSVCADKLLNNEQASTNEHTFKIEQQRLQRFIYSPKWKHRKNCYIYENLDDFKIMVIEKEFGCYITIFYKYHREMNSGCIVECENKIHSNTKYKSIEEAKRKIFGAITSRKIYRYLITHGMPRPNEIVYSSYSDI